VSLPWVASQALQLVAGWGCLGVSQALPSPWWQVQGERLWVVAAVGQVGGGQAAA
jgi:hypothetical protein